MAGITQLFVCSDVDLTRPTYTRLRNLSWLELIVAVLELRVID